jgi:hypothetical protein
MADEVEQKLEAPKIQPPSDATKQDGVISGQPNQEVHSKAFLTAHKDDKYPSGIMPAIHESFGIEGDLTDADTGNKPSKAQEALAAHGEAQSPSTSIGPGQMQIRNIEALAAKYPQLKQFGDPVKAAMDPVTAPFFVAAYVANEAENITSYNKQHSGEQGFKPIPINADTLGYRYNPDVYSDKNGEYRSLEPWEKSYRRVIGPLSESMAVCPWPSPEVLQRSHHLQKVREARSDLGQNSW